MHPFSPITLPRLLMWEKPTNPQWMGGLAINWSAGETWISPFFGMMRTSGAETQSLLIIPKSPNLGPKDWKKPSRIENFKRAAHQTPIFRGEFWRSRLNISIEIETFKRDWHFQARLDFFNLWALRDCQGNFSARMVFLPWSTSPPLFGFAILFFGANHSFFCKDLGVRCKEKVPASFRDVLALEQ